MSTVNRAIFKAYDIRGLSPGDIDASIAERIGRATVLHTNARRVVVGRDMRATSSELAAAVIRGVTAQGADALDIGLSTTPMFNFAVASEQGRDAGIMVSASHNPAKYNGFKIDYHDGIPVSGITGLPEVANLVVAGNFPSATTPGVVEVIPGVLEQYLDRVTSFIDPAALPPVRMVIDCGNGMGGLTMPHLAPRFRGEVTPLFWELDGSFPNHEANPIKPENVRKLGEVVRETGSAIGFALDGDADRIGIVDERGELVRGDLAFVLLARLALERHPGATILYDLRSSRAVPEEIRAAGGVPVPTRAGHAIIKVHLREANAVLAGELSTHYFFKEFYGVECIELAMFQFLTILTRSGRSLSDLIAPLQRYAHSGEVNFEARDRDAVLAELRARYASSAREVSTLDGLSFDFGMWWFIVRASNTEPLLRLIVETPSAQETERRVAEIGKLIRGE